MKKTLEKILKAFDDSLHKIKKTQIILIVNVQNQIDTPIVFEKANPIEMFTEEEFNQINFSLGKLGIYYHIYFTEIKFIHDVLNNELNKNEIIVFNLARNGLHEGKKSLIPSFCDLMSIKYTGTNAFGQALCRNKFVYNKYLQGIGYNMPKTYALHPSGKWLGGNAPIENNKYIIKPICESGSIGITLRNSITTKMSINDIDFINNQSMIYQEFIDGSEVECPFFIIDNDIYCLPPVELTINRDLLDQNSSSKNEYGFRMFKSNINNKLIDMVKILVPLLQLKNYGRLDFKINKNGDIYLFDVATMPFLCDHSSFVYSMNHLGFDKKDIFKLILFSTFKFYNLI